MHAVAAREERLCTNLRETREGNRGGFGGREGKGEVLELYCNLKKINKRWPGVGVGRDLLFYVVS